MGTWGTGPFDSDMAEDFADRLERLSPGERAAAVDSRLRQAVSGDPDKLLGEVLAAAAVVAANLPGSPELSWNEDYPGIESWLADETASGLAPLATEAIDRNFPPDGWYWQSWVDEEEAAEARVVVDTVR